MSKELLERYDRWLVEGDKEVAALILREPLVPVEGKGSVFFPSTYPKSKDGTFKGGYDISDLGNDSNVCTVDSVGSQANRIEPLFGEGDYAKLVPQIFVVAGDLRVNLLQAGHRTGDAFFRCSPYQHELQQAFLEYKKGNHEALARFGPTSLLFGFWDSRDTFVRQSRFFQSVIRAWNVRQLSRSASYSPPVDYQRDGILEEVVKDSSAHEARSEKGFLQSLATGTHGGVLALGGIQREVTFQLTALRTLRGATPEKTLVLRRYILGLGLVAFTNRPPGFLRQGCNLVPDSSIQRTCDEVGSADGIHTALILSKDQALAYASVAAQAFGVGKNREAPFDKQLAAKDLDPDSEKKKSKSKKD